MGAAEKDSGARSFSVIFAQLADGDANREVSQELYDLVTKLYADAEHRGTQSKGSVTVKLSVSVDPRGVVGMAWETATREPKPQRIAGILWMDPKTGNLMTQNPRQPTLPHVIEGGRREVIDEATGEVRSVREV
jgi:hypothetical protein